jgi:Leucine-rich repeat (LRR) protein
MIVRTLAFALLALHSVLAFYEAPDDCDWDFIDDESGFAGGVSLTCHLSAINSHLEKTNFSVIPNEGTRKLTVKCKETSLSQLEARGFASLNYLEELVIDSCKLEHVPALAFDGLNRLKSLKIQSKFTNEFSMASEGLAGLTSLQNLDLSGNGLRSMPPDELCHLPSLTSLNLSHNELGSVADLGLVSSKCRLLRLESMDLSANEITTLHSHMLSAHWPQLKTLNMKNNFVRHVEDMEVAGLKKCSLETLDLSNNQINALPASLLQHCHGLTELRLANNSLTSLDAAFFDGLKRLQTLDLSGNRMASMTGRQTRDLGSVKELDLSSNQLSILTESTRVFDAMASSLQVLRLNNNRLKTIEAKVFQTLANLKELDLSKNELAALAKETLSGLGRLTHLHLAHNDLNNIHEEAFTAIPEVLVLDLSHNKLRQSPNSLKSLGKLQTLDLSFNGIHSLANASILEMTSLWRLQLNGNSITNITKGLFNKLDSLQILDLSGNIINSVEAGSFDDNQKLRAVRLDSNNLTKMEGLFSNLANLMWLNVSSNAIINFDYVLLPTSLRWLDISHNLIVELGNYFDLNTELALAELDVSFNKLAQLGPHNIPDSIETLLVNDNYISQIVPYTFFKKTQLIKVDLTVNNLKQIDRNALRLSTDVTRLPDFFLTGNPIECDCEMVWFKSINSGSTLQNYPLVKDIESIYCRLVYARQQTFVPLVEAKNEQFLCPYTTHCFALCQCCDFDACDCEMTCPDNCTCYHDSSWSKNIAECSNAGFYDLPDQLPMDATEVFLDGNIFPELNSHTFIGRKNLQILHLNNSKIHTIQNKTFNGLKSLTILHLEDNDLTSLKGYEFETLTNLKELYLEGNLLETVHNTTFKFMRSLEILHLDGNRLIDFPAWQLAFNPLLVTVKLAENLWSCECQFIQRFRAWMNVYGGKVSDAEAIECVTNEADGNGQLIISSHVEGNAMCIDESNSNLAVATTRVQEMVSEDYLPLLAATLATFAFILLILLAVFVYRNTLRVWLHSKYGVRVFDNLDVEASGNTEGDSRKLFDAFISYSPKDDAFAREVLAAELERPDLGYRTCLYHRDLPGTNQSYVADTIVQATEASKRTIVVLSDNFLKSEWSRYDYKSGLHQAMRSGRKKLIVIMLGDVARRDMDPDLRLYLKTNIVLDWGDKLFWEKLKYALPDNKKTLRPKSASSGHSSVVSSTTSVLSSVANSSTLGHGGQMPIGNGMQHYGGQPRYTMRPNLVQLNNNHQVHHIYNMPGPQLQQQPQIYGSLDGGRSMSPGAVHI